MKRNWIRAALNDSNRKLSDHRWWYHVLGQTWSNFIRRISSMMRHAQHSKNHNSSQGGRLSENSSDSYSCRLPLRFKPSNFIFTSIFKIQLFTRFHIKNYLDKINTCVLGQTWSYFLRHFISEIRSRIEFVGRVDSIRPGCSKIETNYNPNPHHGWVMTPQSRLIYRQQKLQVASWRSVFLDARVKRYIQLQIQLKLHVETSNFKNSQILWRKRVWVSPQDGSKKR